MSSSLFWVVMQRMMVFVCRSFETDHWSRLQESSSPKGWDRYDVPKRQRTKNQHALRNNLKSEDFIYTAAEACNFNMSDVVKVCI
jgi:hypothetical protein